MEPDEMKCLYLEHREVEEARDLDAVVATFDEDCFLENVALASRARGRAEVRRSYEALFRAFPDLSPMSSGEAYGDDVFVTWGTVHGTMDGAWLGFEPTHREFYLRVCHCGPLPQRAHAGRAAVLRPACTV